MSPYEEAVLVGVSTALCVVGIAGSVIGSMLARQARASLERSQALLDEAAILMRTGEVRTWPSPPIGTDRRRS